MEQFGVYFVMFASLCSKPRLKWGWGWDKPLILATIDGIKGKTKRENGENGGKTCSSLQSNERRQSAGTLCFTSNKELGPTWSELDREEVGLVPINKCFKRLVH